MPESFDLPHKRDNLTGRITNADGRAVARERALLQRRQQKAIRDYPEEARTARELVQNIDFPAIQAMYEEINLRSAGSPQKPPEMASEGSLLRPVPKVPTNSVTAQDIFFVAVPESTSQGRRLRTMSYQTMPNAVLVNLRMPHTMKSLKDLKNMPRPLSELEARAAKYHLFGFYEILFHELGHAYGFLYDTERKVANNDIYGVSQSGVAVSGTIIRPVPGSPGRFRMKQRMDLEYWLEGFNELQTFFRMREYMRSHSLRFGDIRLERSELWDMFLETMRHTSYGPTTLTIDLILEHISEQTNVPYPKVFEAFSRIFQTKGGRKELISLLQEIVGPVLAKQMRDTSPHDQWDADKLSHEILMQLKTDPKMIEYIEEIITHPKRHRSAASEDGKK
jgi:hypothetical protein